MPYDFVQDPVRLHAGASAPRSGVYRVFHQRHRMPHLVIILAGQTLPECKRCGSRVEFAPFMHVESAETDPDFQVTREGVAG